MEIETGFMGDIRNSRLRKKKNYQSTQIVIYREGGGLIMGYQCFIQVLLQLDNGYEKKLC